MQKKFVSLAIILSFFLLCFSWVLTYGGGPTDSHTWDEKVVNNPQWAPPGATSFGGIYLQLGNLGVLVWKKSNPLESDNWAGQRFGKFNYIILRSK